MKASSIWSMDVSNLLPLISWKSMYLLLWLWCTLYAFIKSVLVVKKVKMYSTKMEQPLVPLIQKWQIWNCLLYNYSCTDFYQIANNTWQLLAYWNLIHSKHIFHNFWTEHGKSGQSGHKDIFRFWAIFEACKFFFVNKWKRVA